jgi:peptidoglycan/LPS O-acetylase OafA/YrhL
LLRGLAALAVVVYHFTNHWDSIAGDYLPDGNLIREVGYWGHQGVFVFFVISGFVIPLSLYKCNFRLRDFFRFMWKRIIRLEPPYVASIAIVLGLSLYYHLTHDKSWIFDPARTAFHFFYLIPFTDYDWYDPLYWTLALEFQFYIILAILFPLINHQNRLYRYLGFLIFLCSSLLIFEERYAIHYASLFALGIVCYWHVTRQIGKNELIFLIIGVCLWTFIRFDIDLVLSGLITVAFIYWVKSDSTWSNKFGDISYSLYLTHGALGGHVLALSATGVTNTGLKYLIILATIIGAMIFAYIFWWLIERPARKASQSVKFPIRNQTGA